MKSPRVLIVGGCFDLLHPGHIDFLSKARGLCDYLIVLLEPDEKVRMMKGADRPRTNLKSRIKNLEKTGLVDEVITLPVLKTDIEYQREVKKIIALWLDGSMAKKKTINHGTIEPYNHNVFYFGITKNDRNQIKNQKIRALAKKFGIEVIEVNKLLPEFSTTKEIVNSSKLLRGRRR